MERNKFSYLFVTNCCSALLRSYAATQLRRILKIILYLVECYYLFPAIHTISHKPYFTIYLFISVSYGYFNDVFTVFDLVVKIVDEEELENEAVEAAAEAESENDYNIYYVSE